VSVVVRRPPSRPMLMAAGGTLSALWTAAPGAGPAMHELELSGPLLRRPLVWGGLDASMDHDVSTLKQGSYEARVRATVQGVKTPWSESASIMIIPALATVLAFRISGGKLSARWTAFPTTKPCTYEWELAGGVLTEPLCWPDLSATSIENDVSTLPEGVYTGRVRTTFGGRTTRWSEPATTVVTTSAPGAATLARLLHAARTPALSAIGVLRQEISWISTTEIQAVLTHEGYPAAEIDAELASWVASFRKIGPSSGQDGRQQTMEDAHFDDLEAAKKLGLPLSEIIVHVRNFYVCAIQACYGYGAQRTVMPLHGATFNAAAHSIHVPIDAPITRVAGSASVHSTNPPEMRVVGLSFYAKGSNVPFRQIGHPNAGSRDVAFSFDMEPGEVLQAFFGATYGNRNGGTGGWDEAGAKYLGSFGVWVQKTE
jgi:hypothetical protein